MWRLSLATTTLLSVVTSASATSTFTDIEKHPFASSIERAAEMSLVQGYRTGQFKPNASVTRAEFLTALMRAVGIEDDHGAGTQCFRDFLGDPQWFWRPACLSQRLGIVQGYPDSTFGANRVVLLGEAIKMSVTGWDIPLPQYVRAPDHWYDPYMDSAASLGVFTDLPRDASHPLTRAEMTVLFLAFLETDDQHSAAPAEPICGNGLIEEFEECDDGNKRNGDGCSSICVVVPEPIRHSALRVEQVAVTDTALTLGRKGMTVLTFRALAGRQDAELTQLVLSADKGSVQSGRNYQLFLNDEAVSGIGKVEGTTVTIDDIDLLLVDGIEIELEIKADISSTTTDTDLRLEFDTTNASYISAIGAVDGRELTGITTDGVECDTSVYSLCWISVVTAK